MARIEITIDKEQQRKYKVTKYYVFFNGHFLFEFTNRFKGIWYFYNKRSEFPFCTINDTNVPIARIKNLAVAHAVIANGGVELTDTELHGDEVVINRKAKDYPEL